MKNTSSAETCDVVYVHKENVAAAKKSIHKLETLQGLSETFKVLGDVTRLKICLDHKVEFLEREKRNWGNVPIMNENENPRAVYIPRIREHTDCHADKTINEDQ